MATDPAPVVRRRVARPRFWILGSLAVLLALATLYLGTLTVLWGMRIQHLHTEHADLTAEASHLRASVRAGSDDVDRAIAALGDKDQALIETVNLKAQAEDRRYLNHDFALGFKDCADARAKALMYVEQRYQFYYSDVVRYDSEVASYCAKVKKYWAEANTGDGA